VKKRWSAPIAGALFSMLQALLVTPSTGADKQSRFIRQTNADTAIVFVHGIFGDATTWNGNHGSWPDLIASDHTFDDSDIFTYSYPTGLDATFSIDELAEDMRRVLSANSVTLYKKIIYVSHSMGGLVTRAYLLKNREIAARTAFAFFFSTPTTGSQIANIVQLVTSNPQVSKMKILVPENYLGDQYRQWLSARFSFPSHCAYEKRLTYGIALVVTMDSASALCNRALDPIDSNHFDIVKPDSRDAQSYIALKAAYADSKIPELKNRRSGSLQAEIDELANFPASPDKSPTQTMIESLLANKMPHRLYGILDKYNRADILGIKDGVGVFNYKVGYYDFEVAARQWEESATIAIGQMVAVRFTEGWKIYLLYAIHRFGGRTKESIISLGNFLNYDITWDDAERVYGALSQNPSIRDQALQLFSKYNGLSEQARTIIASK
jgi:pimeloyl-ACP methyl ester carboxylesterase